MTKYKIIQKKLRRRLLQIIFEAQTSHIGSSLSMLDIIESVYQIKKPEDRFVLSNGHAAMALYTVLEHHKILPTPRIKELGVHPDRNPHIGIDVSTGSLGQGLPIAVGMALGNPMSRVYCLISDGESAEGSIWEALRVYQAQHLLNLVIVVSANGWGAYDPVSRIELINRLKGFGFKVKQLNGHDLRSMKSALRSIQTKPTIFFARTSSEQFSFLRGQDAHYYVMNNADYESAMKDLS